MTPETPTPGSEQPRPLHWDEARKILYKAHRYIVKNKDTYGKWYARNYKERAAELDFVPENENQDYAVIYNRYKYSSAADAGIRLGTFRADAMNVAWYENLQNFGKVLVAGTEHKAQHSPYTKQKKMLHGMMRTMAHNMMDVFQSPEGRMNLANDTGIRYSDLERIRDEFVVLPPPTLKNHIREYFSASAQWLHNQQHRYENDCIASRQSLLIERGEPRRKQPKQN